MKIFADFHHGALWKSFEFLFEKRLGHTLYRPTGMEWFPKYWGVAEPYGNDLRTANQYLRVRFDERDKDGAYILDGIKGITLQQFKEMDIDVVIGTIPQHIVKYTNLIKEFKPKARFVYQIGNHFGDINWNLVKNFMASVAPFSVPNSVNKVFYHQEFDLNLFNYETLKESNHIRSFVHTLSTQGHFRDDWRDFQALEKQLPEFKFEAYGASCRDGCAMGPEAVAKLMKESKFGVNFKSGGDGFGHVIFGWFAVGRPPIVKMSQYKGKLAGKLMIDGQTCLDFEKPNIVSRIKEFSQPEKHTELCQNAYNKFKQVVDFDQEAKMIKKFMEELK